MLKDTTFVCKLVCLPVYYILVIKYIKPFLDACKPRGADVKRLCAARAASHIHLTSIDTSDTNMTRAETVT